MTGVGIEIAGCGAVSPAGWGIAAFEAAIQRGEPMPMKETTREGSDRSYRIRHVPAPTPRPAFLGHARLRRTSPIAQYSVAAAVEAVGNNPASIPVPKHRLGVIVSVMSACVNYSRRFYDEALKDPSTASPLVFPETVFNAPASHLAALLGATAINYTMVGDPGTYLQALALAADWLTSGMVDGCLVVGAEESDWITAEAYTIFDRRIILAEGAGAVYLKRAEPGARVLLGAISDPQLYTRTRARIEAIRAARKEILSTVDQKLHRRMGLFDGLQGWRKQDAAEAEAWGDVDATDAGMIKRVSVKRLFGEGLMAASAWQTVAAVVAVRSGDCDSAIVSVGGINQQAIAAQLVSASVEVPAKHAPAEAIEPIA